MGDNCNLHEKNNHANLGKKYKPPIGLKWDQDDSKSEARDYLAGKFEFLVLEIECYKFVV